jgi:predicted ribosome quality control (RQC) complex YloA/Tae2 family protein
MITNYYTIAQVVRELQAAVADKTIAELFSQQRGELVITFADSPAVVVISCEPSNNFILVRKNYSRARRNSLDLFPSLRNVIVENISIHPNDRAVSFHIANGRRFIVELFGSRANVVLVDEANIIVDAFLKKKLLIGQQHEERPVVSSQRSREDFQKQLAAAATTLSAQLKKMFPQFGNVLIKEILFLAGFEPNRPASALTETETQRLFDTVEKLIDELQNAVTPRIYFDEIIPVQLSIIALNHLREYRIQEFASVSEAIQIYLASEHREQHFASEKELLAHAVEREAEQLERTLVKLHAEEITPQQAETYEKFGKLLTTQIHLLHKGNSEAVVEDVLSGTNELISIPLDVHLSPAKNAERYFEKAKKIRRNAEEQSARIKELSEQQQIFAKLTELLDDITSTETLRQFQDEQRTLLAQVGIKISKSGEAKKEEPLPFRVFTVAGGFQVWAGKSSENNDLLTTRHTAKNDLWFHARGVGGSHVVLKLGTGKGEVSKQAIAQAASIAAYYSKMKNASMVPVTMCEGKFVRKPKGVPAGTVYVEREQTIFAEPALPKNETPSEH